MKYAEASDLVRQGVLSRIDMDRNVTDEELYEVIRAELKSGPAEKLSVSDRLSLEHDVFNSLRKLDILQDLIEDDTITEIMINGAKDIFIERAGRLERLERQFSS